MENGFDSSDSAYLPLLHIERAAARGIIAEKVLGLPKSY
jgi:hypothetical protein